MSANVSMIDQSVVWNEKTLLKNGMQFLSKKQEELKLYQDLWEAAQEPDFYSNASKLAAEQVKVISEKGMKEIELLNKVVNQFLNEEIAKNPFSDQTKQLSRIAIVSRHGLNYFTSVLNDTYYPTPLKETYRFLAGMSLLLTFTAAILTVPVCVANEFFGNYQIPSYASTPFKVSVTATICFGAISCLSFPYLYDEDKILKLKNIFEKSISQENS